MMKPVSDSLFHAPRCSPTCGKAALANLQASPISIQLKNFLTGFFDTRDWPARWHCGSWSDFHGWLYIASDLMIWAAYFAIPVLLFMLVRKRKDIPFPKLIWLFIAFILLCGTTHLLDAAIFWWPAYRLSALIRFATGVVSIFTVYALYKIMPIIYSLRTVEELEAEIEERKRAEADVRQAQLTMKAAEELIEKKDEFISIASHELKTPVTSAKACLQVLDQVVKKNEQYKPISIFVEVANKQVNKLTFIINDLLDVTRIQAGKMVLNREPFNLMDMVVSCVEQCRLADGRHPVTISGEPEIIIVADRDRLEHVLSNFVNNAFKYSDVNKEVSVVFECLPKGKIKLSVSDQGIGIAHEHLFNIFDRFYRVENTSHKYSGMGMGLYISAEIIRHHEGEIGVNSELGKGSSFWFTL